MARIRYVKSLRDRERSEGAEAARLSDQPLRVRSIRCVYETDAEAAQAVVPRPLEASLGAEVHVRFDSIEMPLSPDVSVEIRSAHFGVRVEYDGKPGSYLLTMPTTSEQAVLAGRERYGEPRKLASIEFDERGDEVSATVERMGVAYLRVAGRRVEARAPRRLTEYGYCFKAFPSCDATKGFDQDPQLVRLEWEQVHDSVVGLEGDLELVESAFDPVADLPVRRVVDLEWTAGTRRTSGRILRPVPGDWLLPYLHQRYDDPRVDGLEA